LKIGATTAAAELAAVLLPGCGGGGTSPGPSVCSKLTDIEHVVIFIQENRSSTIIRKLPRRAWILQPESSIPATRPLKYHEPAGRRIAAIPSRHFQDERSMHPRHHARLGATASELDNGAMDGFVTSRLPINTNDAVLTMGYYTRSDLPFYYAVADAFTICDNYFCSVIGPTDPKPPLHHGGFH